MCRGPFIFRRVGAPLLEPLGTGETSPYRHSLMRIRCDLGQGAVVAGLRFHDERNADNLLLGGNYVAFTYRGRRRKIPVPVRRPNRATPSATGTCCGCAMPPRSRPRLRQRGSARSTYTYTFDARSMLFEVEAALDLDPGVEVADVVLTVGHGALSYCLFNTVATDIEQQAAALYAAGVPSARSHAAPAAAYYAIRQEHISADALAVHSLSLAPQHLAGIETVSETQGQLDRVDRALRVSRPASRRSAGRRRAQADHRRRILRPGRRLRRADARGVGRERRCSGRPATSASPMITARR